MTDIIAKTLICDKCKNHLINHIEQNEKIKIWCSKCNIVWLCSKCEKEEEHLTVCQKFCELKKDIQQLKNKVDPETDIEQFANFIRKKMEYVYCIWYLAEKYFSSRLYGIFFNHAIELIKVKPENKSEDLLYKKQLINAKPESNTQMVLYNNQVLGSKFLIYCIVMSLIHTDRLQDALQTLMYYLINSENKTAVKNDIDTLETGCWLKIVDKIDKIELDLTRYDPKKHGPILLTLLPYLLKMISSNLMQRTQALQPLLQALITNDRRIIQMYKARYPKLKETNVLDRAGIFEAILGMTEDAHTKIIEYNKTLFKNVLEFCKLCYPDIMKILTNRGWYSGINKVIRDYLSTKISHRSEKMAASLAVSTFFLRLARGEIVLHPECKQFFNVFVKLDNSRSASHQEKPCPASKKPKMIAPKESDQNLQPIADNKENSPKTLVMNPNQFVFDSEKNLVKTEDEVTKQETI